MLPSFNTNFNKIYHKITIYITCALIFSLMSACTPQISTLHPTPPTHRTKKEIIHKIRGWDRSLHSISGMAMVKLSCHGRTYPWVRCHLSWVKYQNRVLIRITGLAIFGRRIFDFLAGPSGIYLYLPSQHAVFVTNYPEAAILLGTDPTFFAQELRLILDPFHIFNHRKITLHMRPFNAWARVQLRPFKTASISLDLTSCKITRLSLPDILVHYSRYTYLPQDTYYPNNVNISSKLEYMTIKIHFESLESNTLSAAMRIFNPVCFNKIPHYPFSVLLANIRRTK